MQANLRHELGIKLLVLVIIMAIQLPSAGIADEAKWAPIDPSSADKDWILLTSGEWLWGTIDLMRDESLYFDSKELDEVTIDWDKIKSIRSARVLTYVMRNGTVLTGTSTLQGDVLLVTTSTGLSEVPRSRISAILEGKPTELNYWSARLSGDINVRTGNTNQLDVGTQMSVKREATRSRIDLRYKANLSERDSVKTVENQRVNAEWKVFLSRLFFVTPVKAEWYQDALQNISSQYTIGPGVGYFLKRTKNFDWYIELTAASQGTEYVSVLEGEDKNESHLSLPLRTSIELDLTSKIELQVEYSVQIGLDEDASTTHRSYIMFELELIGDTDFTTSITWDHVTKPKTNADGITPVNDDVSMAYGISVKF